MLRKVALLFAILVLTCNHADSWTHGTAGTPTPGAARLQQANVRGVDPASWADPSTYYVPGAGGPAISYADDQHLDGVQWLRPYDLLDPACGSAGAAIAASRGRYIWIASPDHPSAQYGWADAGDFRAGYSNDPGVFPARLETIFLGSYLNTLGNNVAVAPVATVTAGISNGSGGAGTILDVTALTGTVSQVSLVTGAGVTSGTKITNSPGTGTGGIGTYNLDKSSNVAPGTTLTISQTNFELYQAPWLVCNPDDASFPFWIYTEGEADSVQHEEGAAKSADLLSWTMAGPTAINPTFTQWNSFQRVVRNGTNDWTSTGLKFNYDPNVKGNGAWSSTDGTLFVPATNTLFNSCLPPNPPDYAIGFGDANTCATPGPRELHFDNAPYFLIGAQLYTYAKDNAGDGSSTGGAYVTRVPVDASFNVLASPVQTNVSSNYANVYPGPTYLQAVNSYIEDGVAHIYAQIGFPPSSSNQGLVNGATYANGGGLWQQAIDYYTEIIDSTAAAQAAPIGVVASSANGAATISWYDALPNKTYRVYRGNAAAQTTLVGDVNAVTITDQGAPQNQVNYYKVVTLQSGTERKSRVVSTFVSSSTAFVNAHITRALAAGADYGTIDRQWLDTVDAYLTAEGLTSSLMFWTDPAFGVKKDINGVISTIFDLGTTRLPRGGDYTPCTGSTCSGASTTTYDPLGIGSAPAWTNTTSTSFGYYGGPGSASAPGRINNLRRKTQITVMSAYKKPSTGTVTLMAMNEFGGMALQHLTGSPGTASFFMSDATHTVTAGPLAVGGAATDFHVLAGTFDGTLINVYADGVAGTAQSGLVIPGAALVANNDVLTGLTAITGANTPFLGSGSQNSKYVYGTGYSYSDNQAQFSATDNIVLEKALTPTQVASLTTLIQEHVNPTVAISYNITSAPFSATCNGSANDSAAFVAWNTAAVAWDQANPTVPGDIVLSTPNSTCMFLQGGSGISVVSGILNHRVRVVAAGSSAKWSDGGTGGGFFPGVFGQFNDASHQSLINTVAQGATSVTLSACPGAGCAAALALYTVGQWGVVTGGDYQGDGFPTNPWFWDFVLISGKTATDVQFATTPLTHQYKSTWPSYDTTGQHGGPGTIYALDPAWGLTVEYTGLTFDITNPAGDGYSISGKDITLNNMVINGTTTCGVPSQNHSFKVVNSTLANCHYEIDKMIDQMLLQNVTIHQIDYQSASVKSSILDGVTVTSALNGGGISNYIYDSTIADYALGAHSFGASTGPLVINGSVLSVVSQGGATMDNINLRGSWSGGVLTVPSNRTVSAAVSGTGGVIRLTVDSSSGYSTGMVTNVNAAGCTSGNQEFTISAVPDSTHIELAGTTFSSTCAGSLGSLPLNWAVPGENIYWGWGGITLGPVAQVTDLSQDATHTFVTTTLPGGFPTMPTNGPGATVKVHPAPQLTCTNCTGSFDAVAFSSAPPGAPAYSYWLQTTTGATTPAVIGVWGSMVSVTMTVGPVYGGASSPTFSLDGPFVDYLNTTTRTVWSGEIVNPKVGGQRVMLPTTTSGAQSGDTITAPGGGAWLESAQITPHFSSTPGDIGTTAVTTEIITNHGVINFLLKRDLDPAANDNSPMWLDQAA